MAKPSEMNIPDTPTTERALPPAEAGTSTAAGAATPTAAGSKSVGRAEPRAVPGQGGQIRREAARVSTSVGAAREPASLWKNGRPTEPAEMRREIERTRARMSGTLDALESRVVREREALERRKEELVDRATLKGFREKLSREPWRSVALAFVAGYVVAAIRD